MPICKLGDFAKNIEYVLKDNIEKKDKKYGHRQHRPKDQLNISQLISKFDKWHNMVSMNHICGYY